jgi:hypothetical protein
MASKKSSKKEIERANKFAEFVNGRRAKRASVNQLRKDYCLARDRYDEIGRELGRMTGVHKMPRFKHRTVKCRVRASR